MERRGSGFKKIKGDYRKEVNYKESLEPQFYSDNKSFWVTLYNLNYDVPIEKKEKVAIGDEKVAIGDEKVTIESINRKCENAGITNIMREHIIEFYQLAREGQIFGRKDIADYLNFSYANAGKVITAMKKAEIITTVEGKGKGKYLFSNTFISFDEIKVDNVNH
nr:hypothetical protein [Fusibacter sp. 3D3]